MAGARAAAVAAEMGERPLRRDEGPLGEGPLGEGPLGEGPLGEGPLRRAAFLGCADNGEVFFAAFSAGLFETFSLSIVGDGIEDGLSTGASSAPSTMGVSNGAGASGMLNGVARLPFRVGTKAGQLTGLQLHQRTL